MACSCRLISRIFFVFQLVLKQKTTVINFFVVMKRTVIFATLRGISSVG